MTALAAVWRGSRLQCKKGNPKKAWWSPELKKQGREFKEARICEHRDEYTECQRPGEGSP